MYLNWLCSGAIRAAKPTSSLTFRVSNGFHLGVATRRHRTKQKLTVRMASNYVKKKKTVGYDIWNHNNGHDAQNKSQLKLYSEASESRVIQYVCIKERSSTLQFSTQIASSNFSHSIYIKHNWYPLENNRTFV